MQDYSNYCSLALSHRHVIRFLGCWWCSFYSRDENRYILFQVDYDCQIQQTTWVMPDIDLKLIHVIGAALNLTQSQSYDFKTFVHTWVFLIWSRLVIRIHDNVIKWKHLPRYLCEGNSPVTGGFPSQRPVTRSFDVFLILFYWWHRFSFLICAWTNGWANNQDDGDLRRHCAYYDITVM